MQVQGNLSLKNLQAFGELQRRCSRTKLRARMDDIGGWGSQAVDVCVIGE